MLSCVRQGACLLTRVWELRSPQCAGALLWSGHGPSLRCQTLNVDGAHGAQCASSSPMGHPAAGYWPDQPASSGAGHHQGHRERAQVGNACTRSCRPPPFCRLSGGGSHRGAPYPLAGLTGASSAPPPTQSGGRAVGMRPRHAVPGGGEPTGAEVCAGGMPGLRWPPCASRAKRQIRSFP